MTTERKGARVQHRTTTERLMEGKRVQFVRSFTHVYLSVVKQLILKQVVIKHLTWEGQRMMQ